MCIARSKSTTQKWFGGSVSRSRGNPPAWHVNRKRKRNRRLIGESDSLRTRLRVESLYFVTRHSIVRERPPRLIKELYGSPGSSLPFRFARSIAPSICDIQRSSLSINFASATCSVLLARRRVHLPLDSYGNNRLPISNGASDVYFSTSLRAKPSVQREKIGGAHQLRCRLSARLAKRTTLWSSRFN